MNIGCGYHRRQVKARIRDIKTRLISFGYLDLALAVFLAAKGAVFV